MKKIALILCIAMLLSMNLVYAGGGYGNISDWAYEEFDSAVFNGIAKSDQLDGFTNCKSYVTRLQFAQLAVNMYEKITDKEAAPAPSDTFVDTKNEDVLKAYNLGIVKGNGNGGFIEGAMVSREQMATMMQRAIDALGIDYNKGDGILEMQDSSDVSQWAVQGVDFAYENGFMKGDGTYFNPKNGTTIEQAVIITNRIFNKYNGLVAKEEIKEEPKEEPKKPKASINFDNILLYSENKGDAASTDYFNLYGSSEIKTIQQEELDLNAKSTMEDIDTGTGPVMLACDANGDNYMVDASMYSIECRTRVKIKDTHADAGNAGIVLGVHSPSTGNDQYIGYYIGIAPKKNEVYVGRAYNNWKGMLSANIPEDIDPYDCNMKVVVKTGYFDGSSSYTLSVILEGEMDDYYVIKDEHLGSTSGAHTSYGATYIPTFSGAFGMRTYNADAEFSDFELTKR